MSSSKTKQIQSSSPLQDQICQRFSLCDIQLATQNFDEALVVGRGGFGKVYKGPIQNRSSTVVAIKRLHSMSHQGAPEFVAEVEMLSKIRHCNLVSLIGYCHEGIEMALVYEYMPHGTLEDHLHKAGDSLSWLKRLKICIGAARGLDHLHTGTHTQHGIVHRDVKSSNVLLDKNFEAKISDFGLAKLCPTHQTRSYVSTAVKGTFGYMDPCYFYTGKLTRKSDVYSFGVILLEVICGRPAVDTSLKEEQWGLAPWAHDQIKEGKFKQIIDSRLRGQISTNCLKDFARIARRCIHNEPNQRPTMAEIVSKLEAILSLQERLDSSVTEGKLIDKVLSFFSAKADSKSSNLLQKNPLGSEGEQCDKVSNENVTMGKAEIDSATKDAIQLDHTDGSEGEPSDRAGKVTSSWALPSPPSLRNLMTKGNLKPYSFNVLKTATRNFHPDRFLGECSFGSFFRGLIDRQLLAATETATDNTIFAVNKVNQKGHQSHQEWLAEVNNLGVLHHPNLLKLIGYSPKDDQRLLVYEFMPRGSLENHLFGRGSNFVPLSWNQRINVALGAARGLAFLHSPEAQVICRDFNSSSILLDSDYNAKLCVLWLAKDRALVGNGSVFTRVVGINGYAAPEYIATGQVSAGRDIYSFGVVLLEILTGRRCIDKDHPPTEKTLVDYAKHYSTSKRRIVQIIDRHIDGQYSSTVGMRAAMLAMKCLSEKPKHRPTADEVVKALEQLQDLQKTSASSRREPAIRKHYIRKPISYPRQASSDSGRPAVDKSLGEEQWDLSPWAQDKLTQLLDARLRALETV